MSIKIEKKAENADDAWIVKPVPGYVCKWKDITVDGILENEKRKVFVNVCHCEQIPPPIEDLNEDEVAAKLDSGDISYRIPVCVGEMECVKDRKEENSVKIDVLVNSAFFASRLQASDAIFFRHFLAMVFCDLIASKHLITLDPMKPIILKNRIVVGDLETFRLRKEPEKRVVQEEIENRPSGELPGATSEVQTEIPEECQDIYGIRKIDGVKIICFDGKKLEISLNCEKVEPKLRDASRISLKMTPSRCLLTLDKSRSLYDFSLPFLIFPKTAKSKYLPEKNCLVLSADIDFPR